MNIKKFSSFIMSIIIPLIMVAQENGYHDVSSNSFISNWLVAGPLPNPLSDNISEGDSWMKGFSYDYLKKLGGEENALFEK
jgi:hypothetical protein